MTAPAFCALEESEGTWNDWRIGADLGLMVSPGLLKHLKMFEEPNGTLCDVEPVAKIVDGLKEKAEMGFSLTGLWTRDDAAGLWLLSPEAKLLSDVEELSRDASPSFRQADTFEAGEPEID